MPDPAPLRETFPADRKLARFIMAMAIARNDIEHASNAAAEAGPQDRPELAYLVRLATGHLFEGMEALDEWRKDRDIADFLQRLPPPGATCLKSVNSARQKIGYDAIAHARNYTFHYPYPGPPYESAEVLGEVMHKLRDLPFSHMTVADQRVRLTFADEVATNLALLKHRDLKTDEAALREQLGQTRVAAHDFATLIDVAVWSYFKTYGLEVGEPQVEDPE